MLSGGQKATVIAIARRHLARRARCCLLDEATKRLGRRKRTDAVQAAVDRLSAATGTTHSLQPEKCDRKSLCWKQWQSYDMGTHDRTVTKGGFNARAARYNSHDGRPVTHKKPCEILWRSGNISYPSGSRRRATWVFVDFVKRRWQKVILRR